MVSTLLFIPCDPLSTDSLVGVCPTSQEKKKEGKNSLTGKKKKKVVLIYNTWVKNLETWPQPKLSEPSYQMLLFLGSLKIRLVEERIRSLSGCGRNGVGWVRDDSEGVCWRGARLGLGMSAAGLAPEPPGEEWENFTCGWMWDVTLAL